METTRICGKCGQPLPAGALEGLCPACLAQVALGSEPAEKPGRVAPEPMLLAAQFPQLEIIELLGMGGMGMVYKARQTRLDRLVALKILPIASMPDASFAERFEREARALARLNHPGIVTLHDFGQTADYYYFVMEYVDGTNLRQLINAKKLEPRQALDLVAQICAALQFAHDEKIVHRDIKPENILITKRGQVKIADFGLAKLLGAKADTGLTASQMAMGTLNYMAPEQRENSKEVDHRADIYSLGVVFYEMLTGEVPMGRFDAPSKKVQVDVRLDEVVLHALEREPARRYQQVSEVKNSVETVAASLPPKAPEGAPGSVPEPGPLPSFFKTLVRPTVVLGFIWLGVFLLLRWSSNRGDASGAIRVVSTVAGAATFLIPFGLFGIVYRWLELREKRGLSHRQLPPRLRGRLTWQIGIYSVAFVLLAFFTVMPAPTGTMHYDNATEWSFTPNGGGFEKLGLRATFSQLFQRSHTYYEAPTNCELSLMVYRMGAEAATMKIELPSMRAEYPLSATNQQSGPVTVVLDKDALNNWLQQQAGLDVTKPGFRKQADEIYALLRNCNSAPPNTAAEFRNMAEKELRDFTLAGWTANGTFNEGTFLFRVKNWTWIILGLLPLEASIYMVMAWLAMRAVYRLGWEEIRMGRWTPTPTVRKGMPQAMQLLIGLLVATPCVGFIGANDPSAFLLLTGSAGVILCSILYLYSQQQIKKARELGLWPQLGELPTDEYVRRLAHAGETILAIKLYRRLHHGVSLLDAKAAVERLGY